MSDRIRVTRTSAKTYKIGDNDCPVLPSEVPVGYVDLILENRHHNGIIYLSMASIIIDGSNIPEIQIVSRLRMNVVVAQHVRDVLTDIINVALKPADKTKAN